MHTDIEMLWEVRAGNTYYALQGCCRTGLRQVIVGFGGTGRGGTLSCSKE